MKKHILIFIIWATVSFVVSFSSVAKDDRFVRTESSRFVLNGEEFVFKGAGQWPGAGWNADTYSKLADIGFNCVRLYIDARRYPDAMTPSMSVIDENISLAKHNNMTIILNVHHTPGASGISDRGFFTNGDRQDRLVAFWRDVAERFKDDPTIAGYDIINEPTVRVINDGERGAPYDGNGIPYLTFFAQYQEIVQRVVNAIREVDKNHTIIVERLWLDGGHFTFGPNDQRDKWQNIDGKFNFPDISDPANNYAYTYHCYEPGRYCHHTVRDPDAFFAAYPSETVAKWNEGPNGTPPWRFNKEFVEYAYTIPLNYIREVKKVPAYIGELGIHQGNYYDAPDGTNRGGAQYMEDLYDILLNKYKLSSSFHPYQIGELHPNMNKEHEVAFRKAFGKNN
jgi:hypothetical protein